MNNLNELINSFYNNFILRDIVAKIIPGALLLFGITTLKYEPKHVFQFIREASAFETGFWIAASWVIAFGVQAIGEFTGFIRLWPKNQSIAESRNRIICFGRLANAEEKRIVERYVVIKEACGLGYLALTVALSLVVMGDAARKSIDMYGFCLALWNIASAHKLLISSAVVLSIALYWTHIKHLERQYATYDAVNEATGTLLNKMASGEDRDLSQSFADDPHIYDYYRVNYPEELVKRLISKSKLKRGDLVLEIGAGSGKLTHHLLHAGLRVRCVEPASAFVEFLNNHFGDNIEIVATKFESFDDSQIHYRLVTSAQAFHWVEWSRGLQKAAKLLEQGGYLGLIFFRTKIVNDALNGELDQIYGKYPSVEARLPGSGPSSRQDPAAKIREVGLFSEPLVVEFRRTYQHTSFEYRMLTLTESQHKKLGLKDRAALIDAACHAIKKHSGRVETEYIFTLYLARVTAQRNAL
jgi:SAM-dependent methyltransferase